MRISAPQLRDIERRPSETDPADQPFRVLLVDDEEAPRQSLGDYLGRNHCRVTAARNAVEARAALEANTYDLVVLDVEMPGENGLSLCRSISERMSVPVLLISAYPDDADCIAGLEIGADDYVIKPFNPRELLARIRAIIRRTRTVPASLRVTTARSIRFGSWVLKTAERQLVGDDGVTVPLTVRDMTLLQTFLARPNVVLSRERLLALTQGREEGSVDRIIDNQVSRLRRKLEPDIKNPVYIRTVWGGGYAFVAQLEQL